MIWSEFQDSVRTLLTVDAQRKGAGIQNYIDSIILSGVIELQQYIPSLRSMNRDTFYHSQLQKSKHIETMGIQQGFTKGKGKITKAVVLKPQGEKVIAIELNKWTWDKRNSIAMGCLDDCRSPRFPGKIMECKRHINSFYVYPSLTEDELLVLDWEGIKTNFTDTDDTPYDQRVVKVVSDYAKAHIVREVDKDLQLFKEYYGMYVKERSVLFLDEKDSSLFDMPEVSEDYYSTCCMKTETLNKLVAPPEAPVLYSIQVSPLTPSALRSVGFVPSAPTAIEIPNARNTGYHLRAISNSDPQIPAIPTGLNLLRTNSDGTELAPTNLHAIVGAASAPTGLEFIYKAKAPTNLRNFTLNKPAQPTFLSFGGLVVAAPTGLGTPPNAPALLSGKQTADSALAPTDLDVMISPTNLIARLSNLTGTITFPDGPIDLEAIHDGCAEKNEAGDCIQGGGWLPDEPDNLIGAMETLAPIAPSGLAERNDLYIVWRYEYDGTSFVKKDYYLMEIDSINGVTTFVDEF